MNQVYRIGDQVIVVKPGNVVSVKYNFVKKQTEYEIAFEDGKGNLVGFATVPEFLIMAPSEQRISDEDMRKLTS